MACESQTSARCPGRCLAAAISALGLAGFVLVVLAREAMLRLWGASPSVAPVEAPLRRGLAYLGLLALGIAWCAGRIAMDDGAFEEPPLHGWRRRLAMAAPALAVSTLLLAAFVAVPWIGYGAMVEDMQYHRKLVALRASHAVAWLEATAIAWAAGLAGAGLLLLRRLPRECREVLYPLLEGERGLRRRVALYLAVLGAAVGLSLAVIHASVPWPARALSAAEIQQMQMDAAKKWGVPERRALDLGDGVTMELVLIPPGTFVMGSPPGERVVSGRETEHEVTLTRPFYMGVHEVTQAQFQAVMGTNRSHFQGPANPVECVSWNDADAFCRGLSARTGLRVELPTEAQWEYACRAGTITPFYTGETITTDDANFDGTEGGLYEGSCPDRPLPVGNFPPNALGLHDMHGNIWEWCRDWQDAYPSRTQVDPAGPAAAYVKVLRGGCYQWRADRCRSAYRDGQSQTLRTPVHGFRVCVTLP